MGQDRITIDSHALIWYLHEDSNVNLSIEAFKAIKSAESNGIIYVPTIALLEIFRVINKGRYPILFDTLVSRIEHNQRYNIVPFNLDLLKISVKLQYLELHDSIVFATAVMTNTPLVTKDRQIKAKSSNIEVIW
jgi:PIN domain nuclease of toxin-antitoxin system